MNIAPAARALCVLALCCIATACGDDSASLSEDAFPYPNNNNNGSYDRSGAPPVEELNNEGFEEIIENDFIETATEAISTFSIDVDNASYTLARGILKNGSLPDPSSVRVEDFINYFRYNYPEPTGEHPFSIMMEVAPSPFGEGKHLMRVGLQGKRISIEEMKPTSLVFLIDVSGSMQALDGQERAQ
jgi:Ca-activated chloride channel family protein